MISGRVRDKRSLLPKNSIQMTILDLINCIHFEGIPALKELFRFDTGPVEVFFLQFVSAKLN